MMLCSKILQFSSLEPEIVCRLLYVKDVEFIPSTDGKGPAITATPGQTELPTCPVCLERLDEHISGIATTVRVRFRCALAAILLAKNTCSCSPMLHVYIMTLLNQTNSCPMHWCNALQVCNHRFHSECLQRWGDMSCPVCRYCSPGSNADSRCSVCNTSQVRQPS